MRRHPLRTAITLLAMSIAALAGATTATAAAPQVVATGLDNPRGVSVDLAGLVYVAEAGRGGSGPCLTSGACLGQTGAITLVIGGQKFRLVRGLPSLAVADGSNAIGPHDVDVTWPLYGSFVTGLRTNPAARPSLGAGGAGLGKIFTFTPFSSSPVADLAAYEGQNNPDGVTPPDSDPTSLISEGSSSAAFVPGQGNGYAAVDAGGNDLLRVGPNGQISTLAVFPTQLATSPSGTTVTSQAVPTAVAKGPDGAYYISQLTGFPFPVGKASIYRVVPGSAPTVYATGLTAVTDLAFDRSGNLYVVEIRRNGLLSSDKTGEVIRIAPNGTKTSIASTGLTEPYGIAIGPQGQIYVTNKSTQAGTGELLRLQ